MCCSELSELFGLYELNDLNGLDGLQFCRNSVGHISFDMFTMRQQLE